MTRLGSFASNGDEPGRRFHFWCPGCDDVHAITFGTPSGWTFNGDLESPTIQPSVKVTGNQWGPESSFHKPLHDVEPGQQICCHSYVTEGWIQFLDDSTHALAGQTVELPAWPFSQD